MYFHSKKAMLHVSFLAVLLFGNCVLPATAKKTTEATTETETKINTTAPKDVNSMETLSRWMTYYYLHPQPELLNNAIIFADKENLFQGNSLVPLQAFLSRVFAQNPGRIVSCFDSIKGIKEDSRTLVLTSVWWSGTKEGEQFLKHIATQLPEKARVEFLRQIEKSPAAPEDMPIDSPDVLDTLWACFSATGDEKYVKKLITVLPWSDKGNKDLNQLMIASAAKWSITSNAEQHPKVLQICQSVAASDSNLKPYLQEIIAQATGKAPKENQAQTN